MRLIDAEELDRLLIVEQDEDDISLDEYYRVSRMVDRVPTVDAEPVVRCKDCKHCEVATITAQYADGSEKVENLCHRNKWSVRGNDYCSYGERSRTCLSAHHLNAQ